VTTCRTRYKCNAALTTVSLSLTRAGVTILRAASSLRQAVRGACEEKQRRPRDITNTHTRKPCAHPSDQKRNYSSTSSPTPNTDTDAHDHHLSQRVPAHTERASIQTNTTYTTNTTAVMAAKLNEDELNLAAYVYAALAQVNTC